MFGRSNPGSMRSGKIFRVYRENFIRLITVHFLVDLKAKKEKLTTQPLEVRHI